MTKPVSSKANVALAASLSPHSNVPASPQDSPSQPANAPTAIQLSPDEQQLLCLLLSADDCRAFLRRKYLMLSVVMEAINNKCFDTFGDVVLQDSDGQPAIIEDYREELASLLPSPPAQSSRPHTQSKRGV